MQPIHPRRRSPGHQREPIKSNGFAMTTSQPAARAASCSRGKAWAVTATMTVLPVSRVGSQSACRFPAVHTRHGQVHQDDVGLNATSHFNRFRAASRLCYWKLTEGQIFHEHLASVGRVINDENRWLDDMAQFLLLRFSLSNRLLRRFVPDVQERIVAGRGDAAAAFPSRTVQRRPDPFLAFRQLGQRHLQRDAFLNLIEIGEDPHHNLFVLPIPTLGNIRSAACV